MQQTRGSSSSRNIFSPRTAEENLQYLQQQQQQQQQQQKQKQTNKQTNKQKEQKNTRRKRGEWPNRRVDNMLFSRGRQLYNAELKFQVLRADARGSPGLARCTSAIQ